jgi:uncharacterized protein
VGATDAPSADPALLTGGWSGRVVDADVHVNVPSIDVLRPFLAQPWIEYVSETGFEAPPQTPTLYPPGAATTVAARWRRSDGRPPASDLETVQRDLLDPFNVECAVLNCYWGVEQIRHPDFALALARAVNDWLIAEWLDRDDRLRASIVVPGTVPAEAAAEIDRVGSHPGFVQVLLPVRSSRLYGQRLWHPVWEAIVRNDLVAGIHYGGVPDGPPSAAGFSSWFLEDYVAHMQVFQSQLTSLIAEGVFEKFPAARVALLEGGFTWLGPMMWRLNKEWKGLRREIPWVKRLPSETIRERVKLSTQPLDAGGGDRLGYAVEWLGSEDMLMYASDYPHGHADTVACLLDVLPQDARVKVMGENARSHYRI